jgi:shikimate dehydrogenase
MTDRYAVVGNPVAHSLSPEIHAAFARQTAQDITYEKIPAPLDAFEATVRQFFDEGGKGVNVTVPFKFEAFRLCQPIGSAVEARAVNTVACRDGKLLGYNTDGVGLITDLARNCGFSVSGRRVLVLGAGGATYGVMQPLLEAGAESLAVVNRTFAKATELVARFSPMAKATQLTALPYEALCHIKFDLVINATSAGLRDEMPPLPVGIFAPGALAYEMVYGRQTPFMTFAQNDGARAADGLGMLVEQAAESFVLWRGVRPATQAVIAALRARR